MNPKKYASFWWTTKPSMYIMTRFFNPLCFSIVQFSTKLKFPPQWGLWVLGRKPDNCLRRLGRVWPVATRWRWPATKHLYSKPLFIVPINGWPYAAFAVSFGRLEDRCPWAGGNTSLVFYWYPDSKIMPAGQISVKKNKFILISGSYIKQKLRLSIWPTVVWGISPNRCANPPEPDS